MTSGDNSLSVPGWRPLCLNREAECSVVPVLLVEDRDLPALLS